MRRLALPLVALLALALVSSAFAAPRFVVTGRGWGHAVGMSQWGAYGMVVGGHATTHGQILAHYYPGTELETRRGVTVRVLLATGASSVTVGSASSFKVKSRTVPAGDYTVSSTSDGRIRVSGVGRFKSPLRFSPGTSHLELGGKPYRGHLDVRRSDGRLQVRNALGRELYLRGVVPGEVPSTWPAPVLRAQAVAARSWLMRGLRPGEWFDVYDDTRSQVYGGVWYERSSTNDAITATKNEVLAYGGAVAQAFYHSSSGGRTAASVDVWGGNVPYLASVPDFDLHSANPHRLWKHVLSAGELGARLGSPKPADAALTRDASGLAQELTVSGSGWSRSVVGSEMLRSRMAVKSARFWIGVLSLRAGPSTITYGESARLRGIARSGRTIGWREAHVQRKTTGSWGDLGSALPNGAWSKTHKPRRTTDYRLRSGNATGEVARVSVATKVRFHAPEEPYRTLTGFVGPRRDGVAVALERKSSGGTWVVVGGTTTGGDGTFSFDLARGGTYRASADAGAGLLPGQTPPLTVS